MAIQAMHLFQKTLGSQHLGPGGRSRSFVVFHARGGGYLGEASECDASEGRMSLPRSRGTDGTVLRAIGAVEIIELGTSRAIFSEMRPNVIFPFGISPTRSRSTGDASLRCFGGGQMFSYVRTDPHFNVSQS